MASEREYLISIGLAKQGRGRFSREAKAALAKARSEGMTFDEPPAPTAPRRVRVERDVPKPRESKPAGIGVTELRPRTLAPDAVIYHTTCGGKKVTISDRNICGKCGVSLSHHSCVEPTALVRGVLGYVPVTIE